jgi:hypothetical protein
MSFTRKFLAILFLELDAENARIITCKEVLKFRRRRYLTTTHRVLISRRNYTFLPNTAKSSVRRDLHVIEGHLYIDEEFARSRDELSSTWNSACQLVSGWNSDFDPAKREKRWKTTVTEDPSSDEREGNMRTQYIRRSLLPHCQSLTLNCFLALCTVLIAGRAFAQQGPAAGPADKQTVGDENPGPQRTASSGREAPAAMPDAPSTSQHLNSSKNSLTFGERSRIYAHSIFSPYTVVGPALGAGIGQWENEPPEWKQGAEGYARRFGSGAGRRVIAETIRFGVAATDGEDPRFHRSDETGVWNRARHVIVETFTSQTSSGARIPAFSLFTGTYGAAFIANTWYPDSRATAGGALRRGSTALGASLGFRLFEEFMPRKYYKALHAKD